MIERAFAQDRAAQLKAAWRALRAVPGAMWETDSRLTVSLFVLQALQAVLPLAQLWVAKLIIDRLVSALRLSSPTSASSQILWLVALELGLAVAGLAAREVVSMQRQLLAERLTGHVTLRILAHAQTLDLEILERSEFYDHLRRIEESAFYRPASLLFQLLTVVQSSVTLLGTGIILLRLQPLAFPLLLLAAIPYALVQSGAAIQLYTLSTDYTPEVRQARYLSHLLTTDAGAKEVRVFGLGAHLLARYRSIIQQHERRIAGLVRGRAVRSALTALLPAVVYAGIFAYLAVQALDRHLTIGDLTLYIGLVLRSQDVLQQMMLSLSGIVENSLFLDDYQAFLALQSGMRSQPGAVDPPDAIRESVRFDHVSYSYPGAAARDALSEISLELRAGETVAIVGENGAGKTTLVKMLARLYDPDAGRITVDGRDLRELDPDAWRRRIAVIFQDFIHYYLTAAENIGFGQVDLLADRERIKAAAARSGADRVIERLSRGYESVLGRWFEDGVQLSGGEWQLVALARAFMRDAPILVLDEPTASLDARAEFEIFSRFREVTRDRIVLLISHRFSTVRQADRIYVMDQGRIVEAGTHDELLRRRGQYAELFELQAAGYQ